MALYNREPRKFIGKKLPILKSPLNPPSCRTLTFRTLIGGRWVNFLKEISLEVIEQGLSSHRISSERKGIIPYLLGSLRVNSLQVRNFFSH